MGERWSEEGEGGVTFTKLGKPTSVRRTNKQISAAQAFLEGSDGYSKDVTD